MRDKIEATYASLERYDLVEAARLCKELLKEDRNNAEALFLSATLMQEGGRYADAVTLMERAVSIAPQDGRYLSLLGRSYLQVAKLREALKAFGKAVELEPENAAYYCNLGAAWYRAFNWDMAKKCLNMALMLEPNDTIALKYLMNISQEVGEYAESKALYNRLVKQDPSTLDRVTYELAIPHVISSREEITAKRAQIDASLDKFMNENLLVHNPEALLPAPPFYLAYHAMNDRPLLEKYSQFMRNACPVLSFTAPHVMPVKRREKHITEAKEDNITQGSQNTLASENGISAKIKRIGFLSQYFHNHPVGICFNALIGKLAEAGEFEIHVISLDAPHDAMSRELASKAPMLVLPPAPKHAADAIAALELDMLVYTDIGMNNLTYLLAHMRLAPVQAVMAGHPNTTGISTVDYFLSVDAFEPLGAEMHYTEKLVRLTKPPIWTEKPALPEQWMARKQLGLPEDKRIYAVPMMVQKLHPDFDDALKGILEQDDQALIVLFEDPNHPIKTQMLVNRLKKAMPGMAERFGIMKFYPRHELPHFINACDVMLDPFHFGGGTTAMEIFAVGTPNVTWPGEFMRGRVVSGLYRSMGITDTIAKDHKDYVQIAVRCAKDPVFRESVKQAALTRNAALYGDTGITEELSTWIKEALAW